MTGKTKRSKSTSVHWDSVYPYSYSYSYDSGRLARIKTRRGTIIAGACSEVTDYMRRPKLVIALEERYCDDADICAALNDFSITPVYNVALAVAAALDALEKYGEVGICCAGGCGRTGTVASIMIALADDISAEKAIERFSRERGRQCPETVEQERLVRTVVRLAERHGIEKTLKLLALIEKPWIIEIDGVKIGCERSTVLGPLTRLVYQLLMKRKGVISINDERAERLLGDLHPVAADLCSML